MNPIPDRARELFQYGYQLQMKGQLDKAIEHYRASIELHPTAEAHTYLGWAYSQLKKFDEAVVECKTAISLDPEFGNPYNDCGAYLLESGHIEEAIPYLQLAMKAKRYSTPHYPHFNMGRIHSKRGEWFKALDEYKAAMTIDPTYGPAKEHYYLTMALLQ